MTNEEKQACLEQSISLDNDRLRRTVEDAMRQIEACLTYTDTDTLNALHSLKCLASNLNNICKHADEVATRIQMRNEALDLLKK